MANAFIFPGQGSQAVGMGRALATNCAEARAVFARIDDALGQNLSELMFNGPEAELTLTENAQPALMGVSIAVLEVLKARGYDVKSNVAYLAGHSLGEYAALTAAGCFAIGRLRAFAEIARTGHAARRAGRRWRNGRAVGAGF